MKADKTEITEVKYNILQIADEINTINTKIITNANDILNVQKNLDSVNAQLTGNWVAVGAQFLIYEGQLVALFAASTALQGQVTALATTVASV